MTVAPRWLWLVVCVAQLGACATLPQNEYGVRSLSIAGMKQLDETALKTCLATQERGRTGFSLGVAGEPECGVPPFDAKRWPVQLWTWPWTSWPTFDASVWARDLARVERWYRARGYYDAHVIETTEQVDRAQRTVQLRLRLVENEPVLVTGVEIVGAQEVKRRLQRMLTQALSLHVGDRFDEALYDASKHALTEVLREQGYAQATVTGSVRIDRAAHKAEVSFEIRPGRRFRFGHVTVEGQGRLPMRPIWAASELDEGMRFSVSALEDAKRAIYELGPFASVELLEQPRPDNDIMDITIKVVPGRRVRFAIGAGLQVGTDPTLTPTDATNDSLNLWDVHLLGRIEHRNFLGGMRRLSIEDRPRVLFNHAFPRAQDPHLGNLLIVDFNQPTFLEPRTSFTATARWDLGPDPYTNVFRSDLLAGLGPERAFLNGKLQVTATLNVNLFVPQGADLPSTLTRVRFPSYYATYMQYTLALDLRDMPRQPTRGAFLALTLQHAGYFLPSDWDYIRITPDLRGYVPLGLGMVLAGRARLGLMNVGGSDIEVGDNDIFGIRRRLRELGPLRQRLRGGGNNSVRGYQPNTLGDVSAIGDIVDSGGLRQWEASLELRVPITSSLGAVLFADVGDVTRKKDFRFTALQPSFGIGLRYRTIIGPIRLDAGFAPRSLQYVGRHDPRTRESFDANGQPLPFPESTLLGARGAIHFTIGEAY
jgi:translocation and assembly module TamA